MSGHRHLHHNGSRTLEQHHDKRARAFAYRAEASNQAPAQSINQRISGAFLGAVLCIWPSAICASPSYAHVPLSLGPTPSFTLTPEQGLRQIGVFAGSSGSIRSGGDRDNGASSSNVSSDDLGGRGSGKSSAEKPPQRRTGERVTAAIQLLEAARSDADAGNYDQALQKYENITREYDDLALSEYARIGKGVMLYQVGRVSDAILMLEDEEFQFSGSAEIHAALASMLYAERPNLVMRAEEEWAMSQEFDKRYSDPSFARLSKHWPERLVAALQKFIKLQ